MEMIGTVAELEAIYGLPGETATAKEVDRITPHYRRFVELSPFVVVATSGPEGSIVLPAAILPATSAGSSRIGIFSLTSN